MAAIRAAATGRDRGRARIGRFIESGGEANMGVKLITAPTSEPVTLAEAKAQCRVDISTDDVLIGNLITAAREYCELHDWRVYMPQTWELYLDDWPKTQNIEIPKPPLQSVTSFKYIDEDGVETTLDSGQYFVDA